MEEGALYESNRGSLVADWKSDGDEIYSTSFAKRIRENGPKSKEDSLQTSMGAVVEREEKHL